MFVISLGGMSELVLLGLVERAEAVLYFTLKLKACQRLIVGRSLEYSQHIKFSSTSKPIRDRRHRTVGTNPNM
jgi:hypothetical protein